MEHQHLICEHISVSRKQTWTECQAKYRFRYHLKMLPEGPIQPYFVYGKVVHKIAEEYVRLQGQTPIEKIAAEFHLPDFKLAHDEHYQCAICNPEYLD